MNPAPELSHEDALRLHILISRCNAIRINESAMTVHGLATDIEHCVVLNPTCKDEQYLKCVKELLSSQAINHPGGYPVFLSRWTRMGQLDSKRLANLLRLGETEAVVAVASSPGVTPELARLVWWAYPCCETACFLLANQIVANAEIGRVLADFLIEFLPFETEPRTIATATSLVLQPGLVDSEVVAMLWERGVRKTSILLGFIERIPNHLPTLGGNIGGNPTVLDTLRYSNTDPALTDALVWSQTPEGQTYYRTCEKILTKPADENIVVSVFTALNHQLSGMGSQASDFNHLGQIEKHLENEMELALRHTSKSTPDLNSPVFRLIYALKFLACLGEPLLRGHFSGSSAVGSLMRRQLGPILDPVVCHLQTIQSV